MAFFLSCDRQVSERSAGREGEEGEGGAGEEERGEREAQGCSAQSAPAPSTTIRTTWRLSASLLEDSILVYDSSSIVTKTSLKPSRRHLQLSAPHGGPQPVF